LRFYLDEDISPKVAQLLRKKKIDAVSTHETGMQGASDEEQLMAAAADKRVLVTRNRDDFIILTVRFFEDLKPHFGLLIVPHTIPGSDFNLLSNLLTTFAKKHPKGLTSYTIEFLSR
jgi:predicted nuclease of predicted toxin-antitoxin system